jgi:hypothetical protein
LGLAKRGLPHTAAIFFENCSDLFVVRRFPSSGKSLKQAFLLKTLYQILAKAPGVSPAMSWMDARTRASSFIIV